MKNILIVITYILASAYGMIFIKIGGTKSKFVIYKDQIGLNVNYIFLLGIALYLFSFLLWIYILQVNRITFISPLVYGVMFIVLSILSVYFFKESIAIQNYIGVAFILIGIVLLTKK